jgi:Mg-chelatase subunit ChlD
VDNIGLDIPVTVVDTESTPVRLGLAKKMADHLKGRYLHLDQLRCHDDRA